MQETKLILHFACTDGVMLVYPFCCDLHYFLFDSYINSQCQSLHFCKIQVWEGIVVNYFRDYFSFFLNAIINIGRLYFCGKRSRYLLPSLSTYVMKRVLLRSLSMIHIESVWNNLGRYITTDLAFVLVYLSVINKSHPLSHELLWLET